MKTIKIRSLLATTLVALLLVLLTSCGSKPAVTTSVVTSNPTTEQSKKFERKTLTTLAGTDISIVSIPKSNYFEASLEKNSNGKTTQLDAKPGPEPTSRITVLQGKDGADVIVGVVLNELGLEKRMGTRKISILYNDKSEKQTTFLTKSVIVPLEENATSVIVSSKMKLTLLAQSIQIAKELLW